MGQMHTNTISREEVMTDGSLKVDNGVRKYFSLITILYIT